MQFVALDVETANHRRGSVCQIGMVLFDADGVVDEFETLINPRDIFAPGNVRVHGIRPGDVTNAPTFAEAAAHIFPRMNEQLVVAHNAGFDRTAVQAAAAYSGLRTPWCRWLCSARVARRAWREELERFNLNVVAQHLGIRFRHHDALDDARTCGEIVRQACHRYDMSPEDWLQQVGAPVKGQIGKKVAPAPAPGSIARKALGYR